MDLRTTFIKSSFWTGIGRYLQYIVQIVVLSILARILDPSDFGILGMVIVFSGFAQILTEAGISSAIIQKIDLEGKEISTVFWFSVFISTFVALSLILLSPSIEYFYGYEDLAKVIKVLSISLFLSGLTAVPIGILRKKLKFKELSISDIFSALLSGISAIFFALNGYGYWALIVQLIVQNFVKLLALVSFLNVDSKA